jgi:hypothetical protein
MRTEEGAVGGHGPVAASYGKCRPEPCEHKLTG